MKLVELFQLEILRIINSFLGMRDEYDLVMLELVRRTKCLNWLKDPFDDEMRERCGDCFNLLCYCEMIIEYAGFGDYNYICFDCVLKEYR
jgi:hypothetical protein